MDPRGGRDRTVSPWVWTTFVEYAVQLFRLWPDDRGTRTTRLGDAYVAHAREVHDWPYPEQAIRNYAEATQRLTGGSERPPAIEDFEIHSVTDDRIDDWRSFFDHDAFVGVPKWAACYCLAPHPSCPPDNDPPHWTQDRETMTGLLTAGGAYGYLASSPDASRVG